MDLSLRKKMEPLTKDDWDRMAIVAKEAMEECGLSHQYSVLGVNLLKDTFLEINCLDKKQDGLVILYVTDMQGYDCIKDTFIVSIISPKGWDSISCLEIQKEDGVVGQGWDEIKEEIKSLLKDDYLALEEPDKEYFYDEFKDVCISIYGYYNGLELHKEDAIDFFEEEVKALNKNYKEAVEKLMPYCINENSLIDAMGNAIDIDLIREELDNEIEETKEIYKESLENLEDGPKKEYNKQHYKEMQEPDYKDRYFITHYRDQIEYKRRNIKSAIYAIATYYERLNLLSEIVKNKLENSKKLEEEESVFIRNMPWKRNFIEAEIERFDSEKPVLLVKDAKKNLIKEIVEEEIENLRINKETSKEELEDTLSKKCQSRWLREVITRSIYPNE